MIVPASPGSSVLARVRVGVAPWQPRPDEQSSLMALRPCWKGPPSQHAPISTRDLEPQ